MTREITRFPIYRATSRIRGALVENHILELSGLIYLLHNKIQEWSHNTISQMQDRRNTLLNSMIYSMVNNICFWFCCFSFAVVISSFSVDSKFLHTINQFSFGLLHWHIGNRPDYFAGTEALVRLPRCHWSYYPDNSADTDATVRLPRCQWNNHPDYSADTEAAVRLPRCQWSYGPDYSADTKAIRRLPCCYWNYRPDYSADGKIASLPMKLLFWLFLWHRANHKIPSLPAK